jgi:hypothetical protein
LINLTKPLIQPPTPTTLTLDIIPDSTSRTERQVAAALESEPFSLTPLMFITRYPRLPWWAIHAFHEMKSAGPGVPSGEALLLGTVFLPQLGFIGDPEILIDYREDSSLRCFFESEEEREKRLEHAETCRLARDIVRSGYVRVR